MLIDCECCVVRGDACSECVIGVLLRRPPVGTPVDLDADEAAAFGTLAGAGMVPPLRLVPLLSIDSLGKLATPGGSDVARPTGDTPVNPRQSDFSVPNRGSGATRDVPDCGRSAGIA